MEIFNPKFKDAATTVLLRHIEHLELKPLNRGLRNLFLYHVSKELEEGFCTWFNDLLPEIETLFDLLDALEDIENS